MPTFLGGPKNSPADYPKPVSVGGLLPWNRSDGLIGVCGEVIAKYKKNGCSLLEILS